MSFNVNMLHIVIGFCAKGINGKRRIKLWGWIWDFYDKYDKFISHFLAVKKMLKE
jgi:hypothetical protein